MRKTELLKQFFDDQHRKWRGRAYTLIHFTCKNAPFHSSYGMIVKTHREEHLAPPATVYHPKRD